MSNLAEKTELLLKQLVKIRQTQKKNTAAASHLEMAEAPFETHKVSDGIAQVLETLRDTVLTDCYALKPPASAAEKKTPSDEINVESEATKTDEATSASPSTPEASTHTPSASTFASAPLSPYAQNFLDQFNIPSSLYYFDERDLRKPDEIKNLEGAIKNLYLAMAGEASYMYEHMASKGYNVAVMQKIEKAMDALVHGRTRDVLTILKDAKRDDPQNRHISFLLSQTLYFLVHSGQSSLLPQAHAEAKKSCIFTEKFDEMRLLQYRYHYVVAESMISKERALDLMREFSLLNPEAITTREGLSANKGIHLKAWILLSEMPYEAWDVLEHSALLDLIKHTVGGATLYLYFFRGKMIEHINAREQDLYTPFYEVEQGLSLSRRRYEEIVENLHQIEKSGSNELPWTLYDRYLKLFIQAAEHLPRFDEILLNISLDGRIYETNNYPDTETRGLGLINFSYWRAWAMSVTPFKDIYAPGIIPAAKVVEEAPIIQGLRELQKELEQEEMEAFPEDGDYDVIITHMPAYAYKSFMQIGSIENSTFRAPRDPYFTPYYRAWCTNEPSPSQLPSEIVHAQAERGGFVSLEEAISFFVGAAKILPDSTHGLAARVANVENYLQKMEAQKENANIDHLGQHLKEFWWLYFGIVPMAVLTFIIILVAGSSGYLN